MHKHFFTFVFLFSFFYSLHAQNHHNCYVWDENAAPREKLVDFIDIEAELWFKPDSGMVYGKVNLLFTAIRDRVDSVFLDAPHIIFNQVNFPKLKSYRQTPEGIWIIFNEPITSGAHQLELNYTAFPKKGMYFIGWEDPNNLMPKQIWTQGQGIDNRHWLPCFDDLSDKVTTHFTLHFQEGYEVISNGDLKSSKTKNGITTWKYNMEKPHAPYLIMIAIGNYKYKEIKSASGLPLKLYYYPEHENRVSQTYRYSAEMVDFMEEYLNYKFPWSNYKQVPVANYLYGAMENTTATIFGDFFMVDERGALDREYLDVNAHELAHQWFGDLVTARCGPHHWLQESFATFFQMRYTREVKGEDYYNWWKRENAVAAFGQSKTDFMGVGHSMAGSTRHYLKGSYVLDMMAYVMGEENFKKGLNHYLKSFEYGNAETDDLLFAFHESTGHDMYWFFEQWVKRGGEPNFDVEFVELQKENSGVFHVKQTHEITDVTPYFKMPIKFEIHYDDFTKDSVIVWVEDAYTKVEIPLKEGKTISYVLFDPNAQVLKSVNFQKTLSMLLNQAENAKHMIDRYDAVVALENYPLNEKIRVFDILCNKDEFQAIKGEIAKQLLGNNSPAAIALLRKLMADPDPKVAKTILSNTPYIEPQLLNDYESLLQAKSYEVIEMALIVLYRTQRQNIQKYLELTKNVHGIKAKNVRITWLKIAFATTNNPEFADELISYTSNSYEFLTRVKATENLKELNFCNEQTALNLMEAVTSTNRRLKNPMGKVLKYFFEQIPYRDMIVSAYFSGDFTAEQKQIIERYLR